MNTFSKAFGVFSLIAAFLIFTSTAHAGPTMQQWKEENWTRALVTFDTEGGDSDAIDLGPSCTVRVTNYGGSAVSFYQVPTRATAATSGDLIQTISAVSTETFNFEPGQNYGKAYSASGSDGTVMEVWCSLSPQATLPQGCEQTNEGSIINCDTSNSAALAPSTLKICEFPFFGSDCLIFEGPFSITADRTFTMQDSADNPFGFTFNDKFTFCQPLRDVGASNYDGYPVFFSVNTSGHTIHSSTLHCTGTCTTPATYTIASSLGNVQPITQTAGTGATHTWVTHTGSQRAVAANTYVTLTIDNTPSPTTDEYYICVRAD